MARTEQITKRKVTMKSARLLPDGNLATEEVSDYVREDYLDEYVADASKRWQVVEVSEGYDAGPGGYEGATHIPDTLDHPLAGQTFAATGKAASELARNLEKALDAKMLACAAEQFSVQDLLALHKLMFGDAEMIATGTGMRVTVAAAYVGAATFADVYSTSGAAAAGTAITGGAPAYASKGLTWGANTNGVVSTTATVFDIPSGATVAGFGVKTGVAGAYLDGGALTSQAFASQGTYTLTITYTQT